MLDIGNFYPEINTPYRVYARGLLQSASLTAPSRREPSVRFAFGYKDDVMQNGVRIVWERMAKKIPLRCKHLALLLLRRKSSTCKPLAVWRLLANLLRDDTLNGSLGIE